MSLHLFGLPLSFSRIHSLKEHDSCWPCLAPLSVLSSICPLHPRLPHPFLHFSHLDSILGFLFTASVFSSSIPHHLSLTLSVSPLPCYLLSVCPCTVSPLAHLSLSPCAYCHHAQCPPTRLTPLFLAFCLCSFSFHISIMPLCILPYTLKWYQDWNGWHLIFNIDIKDATNLAKSLFPIDHH